MLKHEAQHTGDDADRNDAPRTKSQYKTLAKSSPSALNQESNSVLVATDAIGMGLNLNIKRIVFTSMSKFDGRERRKLYPAEVKQIAGRAGRYSGEYGSGGVVTTLHQEDIEHLHACMNTPDMMISHAGVSPTYEHLQLLYILMSHHWTQRDMASFYELSVSKQNGTQPVLLRRSDKDQLVTIGKLDQHDLK